jgi:hypothetical protein
VLAAQVIQAYVDKKRRLENNVVQVQAPAKPAAPQVQPTAEIPEKRPAKRTEVGAIWSDPSAPNALGGRRVTAARVRNAIGDAKLLASMRAGRFFVDETADDRAARPVALGGSH